MTAAVIELNAETDFVARNETVPGRRPADRHRPRWTSTATSKRCARAKIDGGETVGRADHRPDRHHRREHDAAPLRRASSVAPGRRRRLRPQQGAGATDLGRIGVLVAVEGAGRPGRARRSWRATSPCTWPAHPPPLSLSRRRARPGGGRARNARSSTEQAAESGKPPNVVEKMVEGRIRKWMEEVVLLKQAYREEPRPDRRAAGRRDRQGGRLADQGDRFRAPRPRRGRREEGRATSPPKSRR